MAKFITLTNEISNEPISINIDHIMSVMLREDKCVIQMAAGNLVVKESYDSILDLLNPKEPIKLPTSDSPSIK
jgi:hypothetical protein